MNIWKVGLLVAVVALVGAVGTTILLQKPVLMVQTFPMDVRVSYEAIVGINVDTDAFHFGTLYPGAGSRRLLSIDNVKEDAQVRILKTGALAPWVTVPEPFLVSKGENKNISLSITIPKQTSEGNYSGEIQVVFTRP